MNKLVTRTPALLVAVLLGAMLWPAAASAAFDIKVVKAHITGAPAYSVTVTNGIAAIPAGKIEVVEFVNYGVTVSSMSVAPWTCTPPLPPIIGPNVLTCTVMFPGLASGASLPAITFKVTGGSHCPNCVRAKLYLKTPSGAYALYAEPNLTNNLSCVF
jgi:hypothetical protein